MTTVVITFHHSDRVFTKQFPNHNFAVGWIREIVGITRTGFEVKDPRPIGIWLEEPQTPLGHSQKIEDIIGFIPYHSIAEITIEEEDEP